MMDAEAITLNRLLPAQYYPVAVQISECKQLELAAMNFSRVSVKVAQTTVNTVGSTVIANADGMPFGANAVDLLVLTHVLQFSNRPHEVLREAAECVVPEGVLAISCFNPVSLFGVAKYLNRFRGTIVDQIDLYSSVRVRDWLSLLGFDVVAGEFLFYRPPFIQHRRLNQFRRLEIAGARWWPGMGSIYVLVAKKKVFGARMNSMALRRRSNARGRPLHAVAECSWRRSR